MSGFKTNTASSSPPSSSSVAVPLQEHHTLPPLLISDSSHVRDTLSCLLSTIIFNRSLGPITVEDVTCDFCDVTYCRARKEKDIGDDDNNDENDEDTVSVRKYVDEKIQRVIEHCAQMAVLHGNTQQQRIKEVTVLLHFYEKALTTGKKNLSSGGSANNSHANSHRTTTTTNVVGGTFSSSWKNSLSGGSSLTRLARGEDAQAKKFGRKWETWQISLEMWDEEALLVDGRGESLEKQRERAANDLAETLSGTMTHILALCEEKKEHVPAVMTERMPSFPFEIELVEIDGGSSNSRGGSGSQGGVFSSSFGMLKKLLKDSTPTQLI